jgi:hypothetical protein
MQTPIPLFVIDLIGLFFLGCAGLLSLCRFFDLTGDLDFLGQKIVADTSLGGLIFSLFTLVAAGSLTVIAIQGFKGPIHSDYGLYLTIPSLWAAYNLILDFWNHSGNPVLQDFLFSLLAYVTVALSCYFSSAVFYAGKASWQAQYFSVAGILLSLIAFVPPILISFTHSSAEVAHSAQITLPTLLVLLFIFLHSVSTLWAHFAQVYVGRYQQKQSPILTTEDIKIVSSPTAEDIMKADRFLQEIELERKLEQLDQEQDHL